MVVMKKLNIRKRDQSQLSLTNLLMELLYIYSI